MTRPSRCGEIEPLLPEVALDVAAATERAAVLAHVEDCEHCRSALGHWADSADGLLLLVPPLPPGEQLRASVLAATQTTSTAATSTQTAAAPAHRLRRLLLPAAAAGVAAVALSAGVLAVAGPSFRGHPSVPVQTVGVLDGAGRTVGTAVLTGGSRPDLRLSFTETAAGDRRYTVEVLSHDKGQVDVGTALAAQGMCQFQSTLPLTTQHAATVLLVDHQGQTAYHARFA